MSLCICLQVDEEDSSDSSSDEGDDGDLQLGPRPIESVDPTYDHSSFGQWEKHTKGIGGKLMAKMGYVYGSGLGKEGEGRIEPVEAVVFPPGRSLGTLDKTNFLHYSDQIVNISI